MNRPSTAPCPTSGHRFWRFPRFLVLSVFFALVAALPSRADDAATRCAAGINLGDYIACRDALAADPDDAVSKRNLAISLTNAGYYEESIGMFQEIAQQNPDDWKAQYDLAGALGYIRRYREAVAPIEAALRLKPEDILLLQTATVVYAKSKMYNEAAQVTRRGAELGDVVSMYDMFRILSLGVGVAPDPEKAFYWLELAAQADHVTAAETLADVYLEGQLGQAQDSRKAANWAARARALRGG